MVRRRGATVGAGLLGTMLAMLVFGAGCGLLKQEEERKAFGNACAKDTDCESLQCATYGSICTKSCTYDSECGDGLVCRAKDVGSGRACSKISGSAVGSSCTKASECDHGACLKKADAPNDPGYCSRTCQSQTDCPDGHKLCEAASEGESTKMCVAGDDRIKIGDATGEGAAPTTGVAAVKATATATATASATTSATASAAPSATAAPVVDAGAPPPVVDAGPVRPRIKLDLGKTKP